jgi:hypothetical protein
MKSFNKMACWFLVAAFAAFSAAAVVTSGFAQEKRPQTAGVDNTKMGPYRALAQVIYADFQKGDRNTAAQLAKVLERLWDKAEDYGGDTALSKTNPQAFEQIDKAMDEFIGPLMAPTAPDAPRVKAAYTDYLEKLRLAD